MFLYISLACLFFLTLCSYFIDKKNRGSNYFFGVMGIVFFVFSTTVSYFDGVDWPAYFEFYNNIQYHLFMRFEPGFSFLLLVLNELGLNFYGAIVFYFLIISILIFIFSSVGGFNIPLAFLFFLLAFYFDLFSDQIRQGFSVVLIYGFLIFMLNGRARLSLLCAFLALTFHYSSAIILIMSFVFYIAIFKLKNRVTFFSLTYILGFIFIALAYLYSDQVSFTAMYLIDYFGDARTLTNLYQESNDASELISIGYFSLIDIILILLSPFLFVKFSRSGDLLWLFISLGVFIYSVMHLSFYKMPFMQRISIYFFLYHTLALMCFIKRMSSGGLASDSGVVLKIFIVFVALSVSIFSFKKGFDRDIRSSLKENPSFFEYRY